MRILAKLFKLNEQITKRIYQDRKMENKNEHERKNTSILRRVHRSATLYVHVHTFTLWCVHGHGVYDGDLASWSQIIHGGGGWAQQE